MAKKGDVVTHKSNGASKERFIKQQNELAKDGVLGRYGYQNRNARRARWKKLRKEMGVIL